MLFYRKTAIMCHTRRIRKESVHSRPASAFFLPSVCQFDQAGKTVGYKAGQPIDHLDGCSNRPPWLIDDRQVIVLADRRSDIISPQRHIPHFFFLLKSILISRDQTPSKYLYLVLTLSSRPGTTTTSCYHDSLPFALPLPPIPLQ